MNLDIPKPDIHYPCQWEYCVIGSNEALLRELIFEIMPREYSMKLGKRSSNGRFVSLHVSLEVQNKEERDHIFTQLSQNEHIKMVL
ncbi:HP0495 family protein [Helicobacter marmotae]|uniref:DUF493 domain-containing protein n=1 Tax=Helicobacter marmotae TaxID=152490 RepID=A0A3D8I7X0_9HELI|nr:DUF493 domain-containing protein [Helicobacter marmotae]RDU61086.1 DUF493 domain-containing protein [Helicobacter marmotae]